MMPSAPPQGGGFADLLRARMQQGASHPGAQPGAPAMPGIPQPGAGGQINPQLLMAILQMLAQRGGMPGSAPPPGVPPMGMMPNRPPGAM